jgi:prevent-host-death family protein
MNSTTVSISDVRSNIANLIQQVVDLQTPITILQRSRPTAVLVDHDYYQALEEAVMDMADAKEAEKAKKEKKLPLSTYISKRWN